MRKYSITLAVFVYLILLFSLLPLIGEVWSALSYYFFIISTQEECAISEIKNLTYIGKHNNIMFYIRKEMPHTANSPLDQFEIRDLISLNAPILGYLRIFVTNIGLYLTTATVIALAFNLLGTNKDKIVANHWSISQESIYATINSIVINQINSKKGQVYFPFIYTLFIFILINNLVGMVPYSFASTSHFILTFFISFTVVLGATILGFQKHGLKLFSLFVPAGCPLGLLPLLVLIEFISYLARNVSLGLRLAANILSGHMLLNILSGFAYNIMNSGFVYFFVGLIPLAFIIAFSGLELGIAFIQAQVFVVLTSSYIKDALDLH
jgi:F-type H+-transporting ATPase subunit a